MSGEFATEAFVLEYDISADDLRDWVRADRRAARWRIISAVSMTFWLLCAVAGTVAAVVIRHDLASCVSAGPTTQYSPVTVWVWQCQPGSPGDLLWQGAELVAAVVVFWCVGLSDALNFWRSTPQKRARRWIKQPGTAGRYKDEVSTAGVTTTAPDGTCTHIPWSAIAGVRETDQRFLILGPGPRVRRVLPKRGLTDPMSAPKLGEFLRASCRG